MENWEVYDNYYECNCCNLRFPTLRSVTNHINFGYEGCRNTIQECPYKCALCGGLFTEGNPLRKHVIEVHEGHKDLRCGKCGITFATKNSYKYHINRYVSYYQISVSSFPITPSNSSEIRGLCLSKLPSEIM